ncbi:CDP-alcohol phosphatidyltransferase family protein [Asanoa iriomotensis]|uniref:CDP-diacylglycerol--glycerol-3-phosphate 3-phosphatidyltransferase n=1 Tax=Asanoa iriomotensis TaxID=234613 RepID=A0ABQ4C9E6_9ACTN|nr:CDP-alcohol phosphatidyltransferase family protein [Asanoa iriomotensis]GIF59369.1 CDP-diacylglycerol--glycerol-3-phosphate 3-phosphatidyltransferase [Asanoa iriomotensis]
MSATPTVATDRVLTLPNLISFLRLLGVPVFMWLMIGPQHDLAAVIVLAVGGSSDWVDGWVARKLGQVSRLGELLDPAADRLYILAVLVTFTYREIVPWEFTTALVARELMMLVCLAVLRRNGFGPPQVHYLGKTATFILLAAFPVLLLGHAVPAIATGAAAVGWGLAWWGIVLYWLAGFLYVGQAARVIRAGREQATREPA